jgi:hypothetical protein
MDMTQDQNHTAGYKAGEIAKAMDRAYWLAAYGGKLDDYSAHHIKMAHEAFADLAAAMGYTVAPIEAPDVAAPALEAAE